ncbi:MAG: MBL fold metallo-hydrolase [Deltaproteobacteria bacterium]|nr:MBL fold metallo-hydrolase [Deltaproteobacteria bacterium]
MTIEVTPVVTGPFVENAYVVHDPKTLDAVIIDPGDDPGRIARTVEQLGAKPLAVLLTHGHIDHVGAVGRVLEKFEVPLLCHEADQPWLDGIEKQARMFGLQVDKVPQPTRYVTDGEELTFGSLVFKVIHTPGHSAGGVCYLIGRTLFAGDSIFEGSIGRTDFPDGSYDQLIESIETRILPLGDDVTIYSGHGPETTVGRERRANPFLG